MKRGQGGTIPGTTAGQRYLSDGSNHISVSYKKIGDNLAEVTKVHVSVEDNGDERTKPHYWFDVNKGLLRPQAEQPNPTGDKARMPKNFVKIAKDNVKAHAGKFNCRVSWQRSAWAAQAGPARRGQQLVRAPPLIVRSPLGAAAPARRIVRAFPSSQQPDLERSPARPASSQAVAVSSSGSTSSRFMST